MLQNHITQIHLNLIEKKDGEFFMTCRDLDPKEVEKLCEAIRNHAENTTRALSNQEDGGFSFVKFENAEGINLNTLHKIEIRL
jgi:hypothetical protein